MEPSPVVGPDGMKAGGQVGWVGAGKMGAPMIRNLLVRGVRVGVSDTDPAAVADLVAIGATEARTAADHRGSTVVFSTLPNDAILADVVLGTAASPGLVAAMLPGSTLVEMSTVSPGCSAGIAAALGPAGIHYVRAPLSGSTALAEKAALTVFASGDERAWAAVLPFIEMMSSRHFHLGPGDEARYMKLVVNTLVGATAAILSEALALGESGGLGRDRMMEVICESAVASPLLNYKRDAVVRGDYAPAFTVAQMIKDFTLISDAARVRGVPLLSTGLILELYRAAANGGLADEDFFALVKWHAKLSAG